MIATQRTVAMSRPGSRAGAVVSRWLTDVSLLMAVPGSVRERLQPNTRMMPSSMAALGACAALTTRL